MKKFRSSKALKPMEPQIKQQANLRMKVKVLQDRIQMLQKSNLNIFVPITQHPVHQNTDYQSIIHKLRQNIAFLQSENQNHKYQIKKIEREKEQLKKEYQAQIDQLTQQNKQLKQENDSIRTELQECEEKLDQKKKECEQLNQTVIQKNVQLKFVHEDLHQEKIKSTAFKNKLHDLQRKVRAVLKSQNIEKSLEVRCICILKEEYDGLKRQIDDLMRQIDDLKRKIQQMMVCQKREKISLGIRKPDIGEEIVRLKKNIDTQLGLNGESRHSEEFLRLYRGTNELFKNLIQQCQVSSID